MAPGSQGPPPCLAGSAWPGAAPPPAPGFLPCCSAARLSSPRARAGLSAPHAALVVPSTVAPENAHTDNQPPYREGVADTLCVTKRGLIFHPKSTHLWPCPG